jgi:dipeptidyl-peptidase 4
MKKTLFAAFAVLFTSLIFAQGTKPITLEDLWTNGSYYPKSVSGFINLKDGKSYCKIERGEKGNTTVVIYSYETGKKTGTLMDASVIASANNLATFNFGSFRLSTDEQKALIPVATERLYRHSSRSMYYVWERATNHISLVSDKKVRYATFNPPGTMVAYVQGNNMYVRDLVKNKTRQLTKDGKHNSIINGAVDWVYEEEFSMSRGFDWNADGTKLAYYRFDESAVPQWDMTLYGDLYPEHQRFKYPKAGEQNSVVDVYICDLKGKRQKLSLGSENDQYIPRIQWTKDPNKLSVQRLNRLQNHWELLMADAKTGIVTLSLEEKSKYYIDIRDDIVFLNDKRHMVMKSEKSGYWHLYMHKVDGPQVFIITKGDWEVDNLLGVDEKNQKVYFTSTEVSPLERHIYVCDTDGKNKIQISSGSGTHSAAFSSDFSTYMNRFSSILQPPSFSIRDNSGKLSRLLEDNSKFASKLDSLHRGKAEFTKISVPTSFGEDVSLNAYLIYPADFDETKKYPLFMHVYGGPGSQQVTNRWLGSNFLWHNMLASEHGYIIAVVDNRGTGARGEEFKKMTYRQLGKYETEDQISAARILGSRSYIDASRIGIWGWSYGGYMSSLCITKGNDVFKAAIAVAPVTNWRYYDNIYTERFMRTPAENPDGYDDNSPINHVEKLKGNYLIVHGVADDNVHFQNTTEMVNKMISKNVPFDSEFYPNRNHGIYGDNARIHLYNRMTRFVLEKL